MFRFDPTAATLKFSKDAIDLVRTQWVSWRHYGGSKIVYFTFLHQHACALKKVTYGFSAKPDVEWPVPACQGATMKISDHENLMIYAPAEANEIVVRLTFHRWRCLDRTLCERCLARVAARATNPQHLQQVAV